jgi:hypothetical protein
MIWCLAIPHLQMKHYLPDQLKAAGIGILYLQSHCLRHAPVDVQVLLGTQCRVIVCLATLSIWRRVWSQPGKVKIYFIICRKPIEVESLNNI